MLYQVVVNYVAEGTGRGKKGSYKLLPLKILTMSQDGVTRLKRLATKQGGKDAILEKPALTVDERDPEFPIKIEVYPVDEKFMLVGLFQTLARIKAGTFDVDLQLAAKE